LEAVESPELHPTAADAIETITMQIAAADFTVRNGTETRPDDWAGRTAGRAAGGH
jgi:hypothetical protein